MARLLRMPGVSADSDEAALENWLVDLGATLTAGDAIASVETEKAVVDVEVDEDSIVHALLASAGDMVPVGDPIAVLLAPGEPTSAGEELVRLLTGGADPTVSPGADAAVEKAADADAGDAVTAVPAALESETVSAAPMEVGVPAPAAATSGNAAVPAVEADGKAGSPARPSSNGRLFASPLARRLAKELDVDISAVNGSGPGGRIVRDDVKAAAGSAKPAEPAQAPSTPAPSQSSPSAPAAEPVAAKPPVQAGGTAQPHSKLRKLIASRLQESKRSAPHFYLSRKLNVGALLELRSQVNQQSEVRVSVNDFFVKAAARALVDVPEMNVIWTEEAVVSFATADISVAVASDRGLVTPTIRSVESLSLTSLSSKIKDAVGRANEGRLQQSELEGGTLSITNLGMFGVDEFAAIINPPQAAILAIGAAKRQPVVATDGTIVAGDVVTVTLSVDHRPVDGVVAAKWLNRLAQLVENPMQILL